jgi:hypothetical protein
VNATAPRHSTPHPPSPVVGGWVPWIPAAEPVPAYRRTGAWVERVLLVLLVSLALLQVGVLVYHLAATLAFPFDLDYGEGYVLNDALRLARGEPIYVDLQQFPMVRSPYPPLFPLMWSSLVGLTGPSFLAGRALSVAALAGMCGLSFWNARQTSASRWPTLVAPAVIVASPFVYQWAGYARVDLLALLLAAAGVLSAQWLRGWRGVVLAAALCTLAIWTKQTTVTAAVAVGIALAARDWRHALGFGLGVAVPSLAAYGILDVATQGEFTHHVILGNVSNPFLPIRAAVYVVISSLLHLPLLAGTAWWVRRAGLQPVAVYAVVAVVASLSAGNGGSSVNYLLEPIIACALALPFAWRALPPHARQLGPLLACVQLAMCLHWPNTFGTDYLGVAPHGRSPTAGDYAVGQAVDAAVQAEPGAVIAEPAGFALRNGRSVYLQPIDLRAEQLKGRWQSEPLVDALSSDQFPLVITAYNLLPADAEQAIARHFVRAADLVSDDGLTFQLYRYANCSGC